MTTRPAIMDSAAYRLGAETQHTIDTVLTRHLGALVTAALTEGREVPGIADAASFDIHDDEQLNAAMTLTEIYQDGSGNETSPYEQFCGELVFDMPWSNVGSLPGNGLAKIRSIDTQNYWEHEAILSQGISAKEPEGYADSVRHPFKAIDILLQTKTGRIDRYHLVLTPDSPPMMAHVDDIEFSAEKFYEENPFGHWQEGKPQKRQLGTEVVTDVVKYFGEEAVIKLSDAQCQDVLLLLQQVRNQIDIKPLLTSTEQYAFDQR